MDAPNFVDLFPEEDDSSVLCGLLLLNSVTMTQLQTTQLTEMTADNIFKPLCEFDLLEDPESLIKEDRICLINTEVDDLLVDLTI